MKDIKNLSCLLSNVQSLLLHITKECNFLKKYVLVGGSALSLHLCHRKSEDLDFFTYEKDNFDKKEIIDYFVKFKGFEILNQTDEQIDMLVDGVKITFFNAGWRFLQPEKIDSLNIASLEAIAAMKVNVLFLRAKYRDYYDLYFIVKNGMSIKDLYNNSLKILEGINYKLFVTTLLYIDDIEDDIIGYLEPVKEISKKEIRKYFQEMLGKEL